MSENSNILDLDALVPAKARVKIGGNEVEVNPPTTSQMLRLAGLGNKLQDMTTLPPEEVDTLIGDLTGLLKEIIPELGDMTLNIRQLLGVTELIGDMVMPPDTKELQKRGITPNTDGDKNPKA